MTKIVIKNKKDKKNSLYFMKLFRYFNKYLCNNKLRLDEFHYYFYIPDNNGGLYGIKEFGKKNKVIIMIKSGYKPHKDYWYSWGIFIHELTHAVQHQIYNVPLNISNTLIHSKKCKFLEIENNVHEKLVNIHEQLIMTKNH